MWQVLRGSGPAGDISQLVHQHKGRVCTAANTLECRIRTVSVKISAELSVTGSLSPPR